MATAERATLSTTATQRSTHLSLIYVPEWFSSIRVVVASRCLDGLSRHSDLAEPTGNDDGRGRANASCLQALRASRRPRRRRRRMRPT
jgi:hypothetical protein